MMHLPANLKKYRMQKELTQEDAANRLASQLSHTRESREVIWPLIQQGLDESEINENIKSIILGDGDGIW